MKKAPVHAIYKRYDALIVICMACSRAFAGMKWKFFCVRKHCERTFIHNLCPLCGRRRGASSADRVGRDPCVPPRSTHCSRRGTRAPPYKVRRSHGADRVVRPYTFCAGRRTPRAFVPLRSTAGRRPPWSLCGKSACPFVGGDAHIAPPGKAVLCGGTHGSRPTKNHGRPNVKRHIPLSASSGCPPRRRAKSHTRPRCGREWPRRSAAPAPPAPDWC